MLHVERLDPCTPHDCGQYSQYLVLAVSTLAEACRSRRSTCARTCARSRARTSSSASSARTCRQGSGLTPPSRLPHGPHGIAQLLTSVSREYSIALVRYRGLLKRTPCGLERLARLPLRLKGERWYNSTQPTRAEHLTWGRRRWRVTSRPLPLRPSALCFVRIALLCFPPMPH